MATSLQLPSDVESMSAREILRFCLDSFPGKVSLACSFQKEESVLLDMLFELEPKARVFAIDTHYLFPETYELWREVERRYDTKVEVFEGPSAAALAAAHGERSWETKPDELGYDFRVELKTKTLFFGTDVNTVPRQPTKDNPKLYTEDSCSISAVDAATGQRRWNTQINPDDMWTNAMRAYDPKTGLYKDASIGDTHSTIPGAGREGRWAGTGRTECGLHVE